ncbi:MAG TPA: protein-disulfide reductase DsbD N-terminal domain-containing protein [Terracidiphilus sp.]
MTRTHLTFALFLIAAPLAAPAQQLGDLSAPHAPKAYIAYTQQPQTIPAGHRATLELHFRVLPSYHVNSHTPTESFLIPTALTLSPAAGIKPGEPVYPAGQPYAFAFDPGNKLSVYAGDFVVTLPVTAAAGAHSLSASLRYQACNNASCFPPRNLDVTIPFTAK